MLAGRLPGHGNDVDALQVRGIRLDGSTVVAGPPQDGEFPRAVSSSGERRLLLRNVSNMQLGPVFFGFIQHTGDDGFGEGNFKALFESPERDQIEHGAICVTSGSGRGRAH